MYRSDFVYVFNEVVQQVKFFSTRIGSMVRLKQGSRSTLENRKKMTELGNLWESPPGCKTFTIHCPGNFTVVHRKWRILGRWWRRCTFILQVTIADSFQKGQQLLNMLVFDTLQHPIQSFLCKQSIHIHWFWRCCEVRLHSRTSVKLMKLLEKQIKSVQELPWKLCCFLNYEN